MIQVQNLTKLFDRRKTAGISDISFDIDKGEIITLLGPSGSGKTTLLNCLAGNYTDFTGNITSTEEYSSLFINMKTRFNDNIGLFDNLYQELADFIPDTEKRENQIRSTISILELTNEIEYLPSKLSEGQYQRALIARALVFNPSLIILDEPFGNLDEPLRDEILFELKKVLRSQGVSCIWVTHQLRDAYAFSDRSIIINYGKIQAIGKTKELYQTPPNYFCAKYFGESNCIVSKVKNNILYIFENKYEIDFNFPEHQMIVLKPCAVSIGTGPFEGKVTFSLFRGHYYETQINMGGYFHIKSYTKDAYNQDDVLKFSIDFNQAVFLKEV